LQLAGEWWNIEEKPNKIKHSHGNDHQNVLDSRRESGGFWARSWGVDSILSETGLLSSQIATYQVGSQKERKITVTIQAISDIRSLLEIQSVLDRFVQQQSDNPFLLVSFLQQYMERARSLGWIPLILLISVDETLAGVVPLMTRKKFGIRQARSLPDPLIFFSDLVCVDAYRELVISKMLDFLFKKLRCQLVSFVLPAEHLDARLIRHECQIRRISLRLSQAKAPFGRSVLSIRGTWDEYAKSRGKKRNILQDIRRTERNLGPVGQWRVVRLGRDEAHEAFDQISGIEDRSWKHSDKIKNGKQIDSNMLLVWRALRLSSRIQTGMKWYVDFLQLKSSMIAYVLVVEFNGIAFPVFTSYDQEYARFGPSIYLLNMLIRDLFEKGQTTKIDFLSDVPFTRNWTSIDLKRVTLMMAPKNSLTQIIAFLYPRGLARLYESIKSHWLFVRASNAMQRSRLIQTGPIGLSDTVEL